MRKWILRSWWFTWNILPSSALAMSASTIVWWDEDGSNVWMDKAKHGWTGCSCVTQLLIYRFTVEIRTSYWMIYHHWRNWQKTLSGFIECGGMQYQRQVIRGRKTSMENVLGNGKDTNNEQSLKERTGLFLGFSSNQLSIIFHPWFGQGLLKLEDKDQWPLLLTWFNFNPSMDK